VSERLVHLPRGRRRAPPWALAIGSAALWTAAIFSGAGAAHAMDANRSAIKAFIAHMVSDNGFKKRDLKKLFSGVQAQPAIIDAMNKPAEKAKLWFEYRAIFITDKRISAGKEFWIAHRSELERAAAQTGVAPQYLVGIIGVETLYGKQTGHYRVIDSLSTLAFDYPPRSKFFLEELEQFLLLAREAKIDPRVATGSYAGAMGVPQFMPSSYRKFGVDASQDGHIDLWGNWLDIFVSVGNYFKAHGWISDGPVMADAQVDQARAANLDGRKVSLDDTVLSLRARGVLVQTTEPDDAAAMLIAADYQDGIHWRVGFKNFYVITRYNHSSLYAMAVTELAAGVKAAVEAGALAPPAPAAPSEPDPAAPAPPAAPGGDTTHGTTKP
jgi:membrane-bound lytic murein transglycosylase B